MEESYTNFLAVQLAVEAQDMSLNRHLRLAPKQGLDIRESLWYGDLLTAQLLTGQ